MLTTQPSHLLLQLRHDPREFFDAAHVRCGFLSVAAPVGPGGRLFLSRRRRLLVGAISGLPPSGDDGSHGHGSVVRILIPASPPQHSFTPLGRWHACRRGRLRTHETDAGCTNPDRRTAPPPQQHVGSASVSSTEPPTPPLLAGLERTLTDWKKGPRIASALSPAYTATPDMGLPQQIETRLFINGEVCVSRAAAPLRDARQLTPASSRNPRTERRLTSIIQPP